MYVYRLKPYLRERIQKIRSRYKFLRGWLDYEYVKEIYPEANYAETTALSYFSFDVYFYSAKPLRQVPATNGILLPVRFFEEAKL